MTLQSRKDEELFYLNRFRTASGLLAQSEIGLHEVPDFIVRTPSRILGLEVTNYYIPAPTNRRPRQEQESLRSQVLRKAKELHLGLVSSPIRVSAFFNEFSPLRKNIICDIASRLATLVSNYRPALWEQIDVQWEDGLSTLPELDALTISGYPDNMKSEWVAPDGNYLPNATTEEIQRIVDRKTNRIRCYPKEVTSQWLLIVLDGFAISSIAKITPELIAHPFKGKFDRLFLFENFGSHCHELLCTLE